MIDPSYPFRLKPRWNHAPGSASYPVGQCFALTLKPFSGVMSRFPERAETSKIYAQADNGQVAQSVEQRTENPCVGGSIPPLATK